MTLVELFNSFNEVSKRITLSADARSLFLAYLQHWNENRRPAALDITVDTLRRTANLDEEAYRRAAISLSNLKVWALKRKAHNKDGRFIYIGNIFFERNLNRRETVTKAENFDSPPAPPSERENSHQANFSPEEETEKSRERNASEKIVRSQGVDDFSGTIEWFRDKTFADVNKSATALMFIDKSSAAEYDAIFNMLRKNDAARPGSIFAKI